MGAVVGVLIAEAPIGARLRAHGVELFDRPERQNLSDTQDFLDARRILSIERFGYSFLIKIV